MGRERPHSDTTECITRSDGAQDSQIHVFFEVPYRLFCQLLFTQAFLFKQLRLFERIAERAIVRAAVKVRPAIV